MNTAMKLSWNLCSILIIVSINMAKALVCPKDICFIHIMPILGGDAIFSASYSRTRI
jgi:hypothetical protein